MSHETPWLFFAHKFKGFRRYYRIMVIILIAIVEALGYLSAVPVCGAFFLNTEGGLRLGVGVSAFERRFALRRAQRRAGLPLPAGKKAAGPLLRRALPHLRIDALSLRGSLCLGDAAHTALACGALRALPSLLAARAGKVEIAVAPDFDGDAPRVRLQGMIRVRFGQIIAAAAKGGIDALLTLSHSP